MADDQPMAQITMDELASELLGGLVGVSIGAALAAFQAIKEATGANCGYAVSGLNAPFGS